MTITLRAKVLPDGHLRLDVPCALTPGAEVEVTVEVAPAPLPEKASAKKVETFSGVLEGIVPADVDIDAFRKELSEAWQRSLLPE